MMKFMEYLKQISILGFGNMGSSLGYALAENGWKVLAYDKFLSNTYWGVSHLVKRDEAVDEYLKTRESHESV